MAELFRFKRINNSMKLKYLKLYEEIDLDQYLDSDPSDPEIMEGDYVSSYRGNGQVIEINGESAKVQLEGAEGKLATIPVFALVKISKNELAPVGNPEKLKRELHELTMQVWHYYEDLVEMGEEDIEVSLENTEKIVDYLEETLVELMSLRNQDPSIPEYEDYTRLVGSMTGLGGIAFANNPDLESRIDAVLSKVPGYEK
jgi:hypothetical protein